VRDQLLPLIQNAGQLKILHGFPCPPPEILIFLLVCQQYADGLCQGPILRLLITGKGDQTAIDSGADDL
jgi:hypothetical protein